MGFWAEQAYDNVIAQEAEEIDRLFLQDIKEMETETKTKTTKQRKRN